MSSLLDLRRLRYFVAVAEELHFGRAAERLHMTQPPLSVQIQVLERDLGAPLFERVRQRVHLTAAGRALLERARPILSAVEATRLDVRSAATGSGGTLRVGFTASSGLMPFLHRALGRFRQALPGVRLTLEEMPSAMQAEALRNRGLDLGVLRYVPARRPAGLSVAPLCEDVLVVALHADNPLSRRARLRAADLRDQDFILYPRESGIGLVRRMYEMTDAAGYHPKVVQEARDSATIVGLVAAGLGIGIVPAALACIRMEGVRFVPLQDAAARSALHVATRAGDLAGPVERMRQILLEEAAAPARPGRAGSRLPR